MGAVPKWRNTKDRKDANKSLVFAAFKTPQICHMHNMQCGLLARDQVM